MALDLNEYIKMSYERPNRKVLEGLGASEGLIEYLMETPGNTNWNIISSLDSGGGGDTGEVWLVGDTPQTVGNVTQFVLRNIDTTNHMAELINNGSNYTVFLNGEELVLIVQQAGAGAAWGNTADYSTATIYMELTSDGGDIFNGVVAYMDASIAPTSVEVSVKAK